MPLRNRIETDYLVVGAGAMGMAFVDTLLEEDGNAHVVMVDRHDRPGGHWNHAYPFVRLHQPAAWYGVASRQLESGAIERVGYNAGMHALASGAEVLAHFDGVMRERFLPSGRVEFLTMSEYRQADGLHQVRSLLSGETCSITVRRKVVDATRARTEVPSTHPPKYQVAPGVSCVPVNALPAVARPRCGYTVVGAGKTGIDACCWLLENGVDPERIRWIMPRDSWLLNRQNFQPGLENYERYMAYSLVQFRAISEAESLPDLLARLETEGALSRIDATVEPTLFRCAVVSPGELKALRSIRDVVRLGRVQRLQSDRIVLERGSVPSDVDTLYVDCSASGIQPVPPVPVFDADHVNLQMVRYCQPVFSAAVIAWVEAHGGDEAQKNRLCGVVPPPEHPADWLRMWAVTLSNMAQWRSDRPMTAWLMQCRLNMNAVMMRGIAPTDTARMGLARQAGMQAEAAAAAIPSLLAALPAAQRSLS